ncbi:uncharacterized protein LOC133182656 [Saccostrea echinata]|uniref:uncharacterized protein LOC133182656 n=1 Tax=Saccostrea echinata TaxID=191078 RepID=UPI002A810957|nr:uncharacterized protein LOC133182656 [Saccostrea echinata]
MAEQRTCVMIELCVHMNRIRLNVLNDVDILLGYPLDLDSVRLLEIRATWENKVHKEPKRSEAGLPTPLEDLYQYVFGHDIDEDNMATNPEVWDSGLQPIRNIQSGGQETWTSSSSVGQSHGQTTPISFSQEIGTIGTITNGPAQQQSNQFMPGSIQQTPSPSIYPTYQQYTATYQRSVRVADQQNQFNGTPLTPASSTNQYRNPSAYTTLASAGVTLGTSINQNAPLGRSLAHQPGQQPYYSQDMGIFQVPRPNQRVPMSHTDSSQRIGSRSNGTQSQSEMFRNFSVPPQQSFSTQGYTRVRNQVGTTYTQGNNYLRGHVTNQMMRQYSMPNVNGPRLPNRYHPPQNLQQFDPPQRNITPQHNAPPLSRPQMHPAFRPQPSIQQMVNPIHSPTMTEQLQSSPEWQSFQQKSTTLSAVIPQGPKIGFFLHCRQLYEHYLKNFSVLNPGGQPSAFSEFCDAYLKRQEEIGIFKDFPPLMNTSDIQVNEPSDKSVLGQWYRLPEDRQEQVSCLRSVNGSDSAEMNMNTVVQSVTSYNNEIQVSQQSEVQATSADPSDKLEASDHQEYIISPIENDSQSFKIELNENWESEQTVSPEREQDDSEVTLSSDEIDNGQKDRHQYMMVKLPFHPPSKTKQKKKSSMSANQKVILSNKGIKKLSDVLSKVMVNIKQTLDPTPDIITSTAESILNTETSVMETEPTPIDHARTPVLTEISTVENNSSEKNEYISEEKEQSTSLKKQEDDTGAIKRKRFPTDVDQESTTQDLNVHPSKKLCKESDQRNQDFAQSPKDNMISEVKSADSETVKKKAQKDPQQHQQPMLEDKNVCHTNEETEKEVYSDSNLASTQNQKVPPPETTCILVEARSRFPIKFHGEKVLCINCEDGPHLLMREILKKNFVSLAQAKAGKDIPAKNLHYKYFTDVFLAKERDLNIRYKELPEERRVEVKEYMIKSEILTRTTKGNHIGIIHVSDAHRLYQYFFGLKNCGPDCIQLYPSTDNTNATSEKSRKCSLDGGTGKAVEVTVVEIDSPKRKTNSSTEYESDATIPYAEESDEDNDDDVILLDVFSSTDSQDGVTTNEEMKTKQLSTGESNQDDIIDKEIKTEQQIEEGSQDVFLKEVVQPVKIVQVDTTEEGSQEVEDEMCSEKIQGDSIDLEKGINNDIDNIDESENNECEVLLRGGIAPLYGAHFRFLVIDGLKFYPFADLCKRFDVQDLTECMRRRKDNKYRAFRCEQIEADFFNRLEPSLPEMTENATLLEEEILFDIVKQIEPEKQDQVGQTEHEPERSDQLEKVSSIERTNIMPKNPDHLEVTDQNMSPSIKFQQNGQKTNSITEDSAEKVPSAEERSPTGETVSHHKSNAEEIMLEERRSPAQPGTPIQSKKMSNNVDLCQTNEVSSTVQTPISEKRQAQRNLDEDFTTTEDQHKNVVESSSSELDCFSMLLNSLANNNNNSQNTLLDPNTMHDVQAALSSIPPTADDAQIEQTLQRFFKSCEETCSESHWIVTKAFVSVLKQNLVLQNELNSLRSGIADLKEEKVKLDAATQRCREITKQMDDIEDVLLLECEEN